MTDKIMYLWQYKCRFTNKITGEVIEIPVSITTSGLTVVTAQQVYDEAYLLKVEDELETWGDTSFTYKRISRDEIK